jgi:hypothetical protein
VLPAVLAAAPGPAGAAAAACAAAAVAALAAAATAAACAAAVAASASAMLAFIVCKGAAHRTQPLMCELACRITDNKEPLTNSLCSVLTTAKGSLQRC